VRTLDFNIEAIKTFRFDGVGGIELLH